MPARDECAFWRLVGVSGERTVCYIVEVDEGLAVTVEHGGDIILAEMVADLDAAVRRTNVVRDVLAATGLQPVAE